MFFGEFGPSGSGDHRLALRDGLWESTLNGHAGAACYWYWDKLISEKLYDEFKVFSEALAVAPWVKGSVGRVLNPGVVTPTLAARVLTPGVGWGATTSFLVDLTKGDGRSEMSKVSSYFNSQSSGNSALFSEPLVIRYESKSASEFVMRVVQVGDGGGRAVVKVDGVTKLTRAWSSKGVSGVDVVSVSLPAGRHEVSVGSTGEDWFQVESLSIGGLAPDVDVSAFGTDRQMLARLSRVGSVSSRVAQVSGLALKDGWYEVLIFDLIGKGQRKHRVRVVDGAIEGGVEMRSSDEIWNFRVE